MRAECPREESNLRLRFRRPALYPLSYGGMVSMDGIEPSASALSGRRSYRLSYTDKPVLLASLRIISHCWRMRTTVPKDKLTTAIAGARSWREVNIRLGRAPEAASKNLKQLADGYGIDVAHLGGRNKRTYTDEQLRDAVAGSRTWGEVAVALGKTPRSGASKAVMQRAAERLQLDVSHLTNRPAPTYTDDQLRDAVDRCGTWGEVATMLGKRPRSGASESVLRQAADRLQLDVSHLADSPAPADA